LVAIFHVHSLLWKRSKIRQLYHALSHPYLLYRHFDINIGILDYRIHEEIFEAYNYKLGYFDRSIPYYMIAHEGKMHQLEHNKHTLEFLVGNWK
jgi:hypothetical protein